MSTMISLQTILWSALAAAAGIGLPVLVLLVWKYIKKCLHIVWTYLKKGYCILKEKYHHWKEKRSESK